MKRALPYLLSALLLLSGCSSGGMKDRAQLRQLAQAGAIAPALELVRSSKNYKDAKVSLLQAMEEGTLLHMSGDRRGAITAFDRAKAIAKELYTVSLSSAAGTLLINDGSDIFYGESYELSMLHYYSAMEHYLLAQEEPAVRNAELMAARSELMAWDSFLKTLKDGKLGKTVFKEDLLAKVAGGMVHKALDTAQDRQIALQLYKDAQKVLFRNYNTYAAMNAKAQDFRRDFAKLPGMPEAKVRQDYVSATTLQTDLQTFLKERLERMEGKKKRGKGVALMVFLERGLIPAKVADTQYFGLTAALHDEKSSDTAKAVAAIGQVALTLFAANKLNLLPPPGNWSPPGAYLGLNVASMAADSANVVFELPKIESFTLPQRLEIQAWDQAGALVAKKELAMVAPLGDIAQEAVAERSGARYARLGARLAMKHLVAVLASFTTYKLLNKKGDNDFMASTVAVLQYVAAAKAIAASEQADTRYWSTLPGDVRVSELELPPGIYKIKARSLEGEARETELGQIDLTNRSGTAAVNYRAF